MKQTILPTKKRCELNCSATFRWTTYQLRVLVRLSLAIRRTRSCASRKSASACMKLQEEERAEYLDESTNVMSDFTCVA